MQVFLPSGAWYLKSYERGYFPEEQCIGRFESCLCMCEEVTCEEHYLKDSGLNS